MVCAPPPDSDAERLFPVVYDRLRSLARRHLAAERSDHTLQPTALVHEAYVKLADQADARIDSRTQFVAVASQAMRRILVDYARARAAEKRGGGRTVVTLAEGMGGRDGHSLDLLTLDRALTRLAALDERQARIVELRFFGGLEIDEVAETLEVSRATVIRDWRVARAFLAREIEVGLDDPPDGDSPR